MATVIYADGRQESTQDFYELATGDWSYIDHVELKSCDRRLISTSPAEFWRQVRELAGVERAA